MNYQQPSLKAMVGQAIIQPQTTKQASQNQLLLGRNPATKPREYEMDSYISQNSQQQRG